MKYVFQKHFVEYKKAENKFKKLIFMEKFKKKDAFQPEKFNISEGHL